MRDTVDAGQVRRLASDRRADADELDRLASQVGQLRPSWSDMRPFYEARSEIANDLRRLARNPVLTKSVVRFVKIEVPGPAAPAVRRRRKVHRHRYPSPGSAAGQGVLPL